MTTLAQVRGMLLEEAILHLLKVSAYKTVTDPSSDPDTLHSGPAGLEVKGRGTQHQIDAIADHLVAHPFSYPQRLLMEAKCYKANSNVDLPVVRNAVGILKDVNEYWVTRTDIPSKPRYHYQYAVFSATGYTERAQQYAFAHDIYLVQLAGDRTMRPIIGAIQQLTAGDFNSDSERRLDMNLQDLRRNVRDRIAQPVANDGGALAEGIQAVTRFIEKTQQLSGALLAMINRRYPVFLTPAENYAIQDLQSSYQVHISYDNGGWYLANGEPSRRMFTFDLPPTLFGLYAEGGSLKPETALRLKQENMSHIQAFVLDEDNQSIKIVNFVLDQNWLSGVLERIRSQQSRREPDERSMPQDNRDEEYDDGKGTS